MSVLLSRPHLPAVTDPVTTGVYRSWMELRVLRHDRQYLVPFLQLGAVRRTMPGGGDPRPGDAAAVLCFADMDINSASAIVTGGASGIGASVARQLAAKGATVVVADLQADKGEAVAAEVGGVFVQVDVTRTDQITVAVNAAAEIAPLRAVVNCAGIGWAQRTIGRDGQIESAHDLGAFRRVVEINLIGTFDMVRQ